MKLWLLAAAAALVWQVSALVPSCRPPDPHGYCTIQGVDNCPPKDRLITSSDDFCRTNFRTADDHILPPEWELMFDTYDYQALVGSVFLSREFDNDGDVLRDAWEDRGGICQSGLRACAFALGEQDNWVFSPHIKYPPGSTNLGGGLPTEIYFNVSFRFTQCSGECVNNFADLYRFDTNDFISESDRTDSSNYLSTPLFGTGTELTTSRLQQVARSTVSDTRTLAIVSPSNGFHLGIRDSGTCGQIDRIYFYYTPCKERQDGLVNYPELVRPPNDSPPNEGEACCAPNSHPTTSLTFRAHSGSDGTCERNVVCECDAGYILNAAGTGCQDCSAGTYRSLTDDQGACLNCPMNTATNVEGVGICSCLDGFFRDEQTNEGPEVDCTSPPGPVRNLRTTTITSTRVSLSWTRPEVTGRDDFFYSIHYSDPDNTGSFILNNGNYATPSLTVSYTVPNLRPNTPYTIRVTAHNGVSDQDTENEALRRVDLPIKTLEGVPSVPRDVQVFSGVVVWGPPAEPNGVVTGYQLRFSGSFIRTVDKLPSESYHVVTDNNIGNLGNNIQVSVRARTSAGYGQYSTPIQYTGGSCPPCPPTMPPTTCQPITPCPEVTCPTCPPTISPTTCPTCTAPTCPTPSEITCPTCPPTMSPPTCPTTESPTPCPTPPTLDNVYFMLGERTYYDGDIVDITDIGEDENALLCMTDNTDCCRPPDEGEFFYPDGTAVGFSSTNPIFRNRGQGFIRLNRRNGATSPLGRYRCDIPDASGVTRSVYINIAILPTSMCSTLPTSCPTVTTATCPPTPTCTSDITCPSCPPTIPPTTCPTVGSCPSCPPTMPPTTCQPCPEVTCPSCPPTMPPPSCPPTEPSTPCTATLPSTSPPEQDDVYFTLRGRTYTDGDTVLITEIGEGNDALLCVTDSASCCQATQVGEFNYPGGTQVGVRASGDDFYRNRGQGFIRLNRRNGATSPLGRYRCNIPDASGGTRIIFINIASTMIPVVTCPPTPTPTNCPTVTCPPTPTPRDCPTVTCPPTPTPRDCPTVTCPPTPTPRDCSTVTCPPTPTPRDCPTVTCPPTPTPGDCPTVTCPPTSTPTNPIIPSSNSTDLPDVTYVGEDLFIIELGDLQGADSQEITLNMFTVDSRIEKRQTNAPSLNLNATVDPTQSHLRVPRASLTNGQTYTVQVRWIVDDQVVLTTAPFTFTYKDTDPRLFSTQSAAASGYVDGIYVAVGIIITFLFTAIIVALLVIVLSWLFITCRIKSGYYTLNAKQQHKY